MATRAARFLAWYKATAIILLNTLLLVVLFELVAFVVVGVATSLGWFAM